MTTGRDKILDGFGVHEDLSGIAVHYGMPPMPNTSAPWRGPAVIPVEPLAPWTAPEPFEGMAPTITPREEGFMLSVTGSGGVVFSIALTADEWAAVKGKILEALR